MAQPWGALLSSGLCLQWRQVCWFAITPDGVLSMCQDTDVVCPSGTYYVCTLYEIRSLFLSASIYKCKMTYKCVALYLCFSTAVPSLGGFLGSRGVGEGAEAEEPAVSKGGELYLFPCAVAFLQKHDQTPLKI